MSAADHPLQTKVRSSLRALKVAPRDRAAAELACTYAGLIDEAAAAAKYRDPLETIHQCLPDDPQVTAAYHKIADALARHSVASDLGPKLLAALAQLGLTPASRGTAKGAPDATVVTKVDELRDRRARRDSS